MSDIRSHHVLICLFSLCATSSTIQLCFLQSYRGLFVQCGRAERRHKLTTSFSCSVVYIKIPEPLHWNSLRPNADSHIVPLFGEHVHVLYQLLFAAPTSPRHRHTRRVENLCLSSKCMREYKCPVCSVSICLTDISHYSSNVSANDDHISYTDKCDCLAMLKIHRARPQHITSAECLLGPAAAPALFLSCCTPTELFDEIHKNTQDTPAVLINQYLFTHSFDAFFSCAMIKTTNKVLLLPGTMRYSFQAYFKQFSHTVLVVFGRFMPRG